MARSVSNIEATIVAKAQELIPTLTSTSKTAVWRLWAYVVAFVANMQDQVDDARKAEYTALVAGQKVTTLQWYRQTSLDFLYGKPLLWNKDEQKFEQTLATGEDASDFRLIDYCAAVPIAGGIKIKVAKEGSSGGEQLTGTELSAFTAFMDQWKAAGDTVTYVNEAGDDLSMELDVYVDPTVIDVSTGYLLGTTDEVVDTAVAEYLKNLEFNGALVLTTLDDAVIDVDGISDVVRVAITTRYGTNSFEAIAVQHIPNAGYFNLSSITLNYFAK
jgi:hypothetical protein